MIFRGLLSKKMKVDVEKLQSDFVSLSSHQLRTPLSAIKWYAELLLAEKTGKLSDKQREYLGQIVRSNERAINLVNDLLDVSRIQQGQIHLEFRPTAVEQVIAATLDNLNDLIKSGKIRTNFEIVNGPIPRMNTDPEKLKRILGNVVGNAVRYTPPQGKVRITLEKDHDFLTAAVQDSGVGIAAADQGKVFGKFFRGQNAIRLAPDGTGLGLFITKSLLDAMGGQISFRSTEGRGTTFYLKLPINN